MIGYVILCFVLSILSFGLGTLVADRRWFKIMDKTHNHNTLQLQRVLNSPVYLAQPPTFNEDVCPDCGEIHEDVEPDDENGSGSGAN